MGRKAQTAIVAGAALALLAVGAYAWDTVRKDEIAEGVTIGGLDVGGLDREQAADLVGEDLDAPVAEPVQVTFEGTGYVATAEELQIGSDVDEMVEAALEVSREGGLPSRLWRYVSAGEVHAAVRPRVSYSQQALDGFLESVAQKINREPRDATLDPSPTSLVTVPELDGIEVRTDELRADLEAAIQSRGPRTVPAPVDRTEPELTRADLAQRYPRYITVARGGFKLRYFEDLKLVKAYTVAIGQQGYDTPAGEYHVENKQVNPAWYVPDEPWAGDLAGSVVAPDDPENPLVARWMAFYGAAGIHGTNDVASLGSAASRGCIRMAVPDVVELYDRTPMGTPVYIF